MLQRDGACVQARLNTAKPRIEHVPSQSQFGPPQGYVQRKVCDLSSVGRIMCKLTQLADLKEYEVLMTIHCAQIYLALLPDWQLLIRVDVGRAHQSSLEP